MNWPNSLLWQSTYLLIGRFIFTHLIKQFWCPPLSPCDSILKVPHCIWLCLASLAPIPLEFCLSRVLYFLILGRTHSKQSIVLVLMLLHYVDMFSLFLLSSFCVKTQRKASLFSYCQGLVLLQLLQQILFKNIKNQSNCSNPDCPS